jgi:hypothetical protein
LLWPALHNGLTGILGSVEGRLQTMIEQIGLPDGQDQRSLADSLQ